jgi:hypothetical protein
MRPPADERAVETNGPVDRTTRGNKTDFSFATRGQVFWLSAVSTVQTTLLEEKHVGCFLDHSKVGKCGHDSREPRSTCSRLERKRHSNNLYICPMECTMIYSHDEMVSSLAHQLQQQPQPPSLSRYARKEISADGVAGGYSMFCNPIRRELIGVQYYERAPQCRVRTVGFVSIPTLNKYEFFLAMAVGRHTGRTGGAALIKKRRRSTA